MRMREGEGEGERVSLAGKFFGAIAEKFSDEISATSCEEKNFRPKATKFLPANDFFKGLQLPVQSKYIC